MYRKHNKYNASKAVINGNIFDSRKEAQRFLELSVLEKAGEITNLRRQVKFLLIPVQREPDTTGPKGGVKKGKVIEKECNYIADFVYERNGETVVEDVKSPATRTPEYIIKRKLMLWVHKIRVVEKGVRNGGL